MPLLIKESTSNKTQQGWEKGWLALIEDHLECNNNFTNTHFPEQVTENEEGAKLLQEFIIQIDKIIEARRPSIVCIDKKKEMSNNRYINTL